MKKNLPHRLNTYFDKDEQEKLHSLVMDTSGCYTVKEALSRAKKKP